MMRRAAWVFLAMIGCDVTTPISNRSGVSELTLNVHSATPSVAVHADAWTAWVYASVLLESGPPAWIEHPLPIGTCSMDQAPREAATTCAKNRTRAALGIAYILAYGGAPFRSPQAALAAAGQHRR